VVHSTIDGFYMVADGKIAHDLVHRS
jgi:hypothetical protein